ncbi:nitroreductase family deazaflavin-dependent oxidoreductase [Amycolatopsis sp., V23-08]|uniref:Nitroreductase family deazaflavin-dependent oxidoreductase n=1 Tax=Amycolatopsis heterodermiae TaxID=3110235 RepID=A0ABU5R6X2_9PSEU|nr:nitroreductase family deazaflavin-dependent oxidoreductase [Amycolatopsis sp., V23-08]MEA5361384.1 nitroreductase family deazaflavin-dependent oxidoreductase [Amycolatopsis sp., V23-08]
MRSAGVVVWADKKLHKVFGGRVSLVALAGLPSLRLTTTGRKSGLPRSTNLLYFPHGGDFVLTGSNWGRPNNPAWTLNLRADPKAEVALAGRPVAVVARELEGEEYAAMWRELLEFWPGYAMEQEEAGRPLPVFVLNRVAR